MVILLSNGVRHSWSYPLQMSPQHLRDLPSGCAAPVPTPQLSVRTPTRPLTTSTTPWSVFFAQLQSIDLSLYGRHVATRWWWPMRPPNPLESSQSPFTRVANGPRHTPPLRMFWLYGFGKRIGEPIRSLVWKGFTACPNHHKLVPGSIWLCEYTVCRFA